MSYALYECRNRSCRFRFPAAQDNEPAGGYECPHCESSAPEVADSAVSPTDRIPSRRNPGSVAHLELFLDNIRSVGNVGSLFRTADGVGVRAMHLGGITATPDHPRFAKSALGTPLEWRHHRNGVEMAGDLKRRGFTLWALEETDEAVDIFTVSRLPSGQPTVLVVGNEVMGIDREILEICDRIVSIPMVGTKRSLNVVVACGIAAYVLLHGRPREGGA